MKHFDIKLTAVSEGHIIKDTGRVVITTDPDPLPDPSPENLMIWDCVFNDNRGTRSINYSLKEGYEYAVCVTDNYRKDELIWAYLPFTAFEKSKATPFHFPGLDDFALYQNGRVYIDSESHSSSKIVRLLERPFRTVASDSARTNPGEWTEVLNPGYNYDWESDCEYYFVSKDRDGLFAAHIFTHHSWHSTMPGIGKTELYIGSYRQDSGTRWIQLLGTRGVASGGSSSAKKLYHNSRHMQLLKAYKRPFDITTDSEVKPYENVWSHVLTSGKYQKGFSSTDFNWKDEKEYLVMGLDTVGDNEIAAGVTIIDNKLTSVPNYSQDAGIGNVIGETCWNKFTIEQGRRKLRAHNGRLVSVYQKPLQLSDETCGSLGTSPVNNEGNWIVNQIPLNPYESAETISGVPISYITDCGIKLVLNKGLDSSGRVSDVEGSILLQVLDRLDSGLIDGSSLGVLQIASFSWQEGSTVELSITKTNLVGDLTTVPANITNHNLNTPLTLAVDDYDEGIVQFDVTAKATKPNNDTIAFSTLRILLNKTNEKDSTNEYMRNDEQLY